MVHNKYNMEIFVLSIMMIKGQDRIIEKRNKIDNDITCDVTCDVTYDVTCDGIDNIRNITRENLIG